MFIWPVPGPVTRDFYYKSNIYVGGQHAAVDVAASTGTPIRAIADGKVVGDAWDALSGYYIALEHVGDWRSTYRHLQTDAPPNVGAGIRQGQIIGYVGSTGYSLGPHLHFDLWNRNRVRADGIFYKNGWYAVDPELYLGQEDDMTDEQYAAILAAIAENDAKAQARRDQIIKAIAAHDAKMQGRRDQILEALVEYDAKAQARRDGIIKAIAAIGGDGTHRH